MRRKRGVKDAARDLQAAAPDNSDASPPRASPCDVAAMSLHASTTAVDLSRLPTAEVIEQLDAEQILAAMLAQNTSTICAAQPPRACISAD